MSTTPKTQTDTDPGRLPMTLPRLAEKKRLGEPIVMVTAYDFPSGQIVDGAGADIVLVGDSGAEVVLGYSSTVSVSVEEMLMLTAATRRGVRSALLVADLPFGSYEASDEQAIRTAQRFVKEAEADAREARGRRRGAALAGAGDRRGRHPRDGPRRAHAPDRHRAGRAPSAGPHRRARARARRRRRARSRPRAPSRSSSRRFPRASPRRSRRCSRSR